MKDAFRKACEETGIIRATVHDLRAKSLTDTDKQGNDAQKLGGHTDGRMTQRYLRLREMKVAVGPRLSTDQSEARERVTKKPLE